MKMKKPRASDVQRSAARARNAKEWRKEARRWQLYVMMLPAVLYLILFCYKPMYGIIIAFKDYQIKAGIMGSEWVGLDNFVQLFKSHTFPIAFKNTLTLSTLSLILGFPLPIIIALAANELRSTKMKNIFKTVSYAPHFLSTTVLCGMLILFLSPTSGIINIIIKACGGEAIAFMQEAELFKWYYVLSGVWQGAGWGSIIYFAALASVDQSLLDAASVDGANRFQKVLYVNFPTLIPTIMTMFVLNCGRILSVGYEKVLLLQNATNLRGSEVLATYVYKVGLENRNYSFSTAAGLFDSVCNVILLVAANKLSRKLTDSGLW